MQCLRSLSTTICASVGAGRAVPSGSKIVVESLFTYHKLEDQSRVVSRVSRDCIDQHNRRLRDRFRQDEVDSKFQRQD